MLSLVRIRFSDVELDGISRRLHRAGQPVHLTTKAFDLLMLLVQRRPAVLSKSDIRDHLWPQTHVSDTNLPALVAEIRSALGDDAREGKFVRTIHGVGYAFNGSASDIAAAPVVAAWLVGPTSRIAAPPGWSLRWPPGASIARSAPLRWPA
jgi:DNA-binding winged helix-turn-helix (wHTH) protein